MSVTVAPPATAPQKKRGKMPVLVMIALVWVATMITIAQKRSPTHCSAPGAQNERATSWSADAPMMVSVFGWVGCGVTRWR